MKRYLIVLFFVLINTGLFSQELENLLFLSASGNSKVSEVEIEWVIGENLLQNVPISISPKGIEEFHSTISVNPNPANDYIQVMGFSCENGAYVIEFYSLNGGKVGEYEFFSNNSKLDISELLAGAYIVKLIGPSKEVLFNRLIIKSAH